LILLLGRGSGKTGQKIKKEVGQVARWRSSIEEDQGIAGGIAEKKQKKRTIVAIFGKVIKGMRVKEGKEIARVISVFVLG